MIRVSKEFGFEMAHALWNYDGDCKYIHGHSYRLLITVEGKPVSDPESPKFGMIIDFKELKKIVNEKIICQFDHALVINRKAYEAETFSGKQMFEKLHIVDYQPTCENMIVDFSQRLMAFLPKHVKLTNLRLQETPTSYAEWFNEE